MSAYIVAEIGVNHNGDVEKALELISHAKICGCHAVKFQSFRAERLVDPSAKKVNYQLRSGDEKESHFEMIKKLEFNGNKLQKAISFAKKINIDFITTPYDVESLQEAYSLGVRIFKTASADLCDAYIHNYLSKIENVQIIIATGMNTLQKVESTLSKYEKNKIRPIVLHCVSDYPCSDPSLNLLALDLLNEKFPLNKIGFSDHSIGLTAAIVAAARGYEYFERHFTLNKKDNGPDHYASSDVNEMKNYVTEILRVREILGNKEKDIQSEEIGMSRRSKKAIKSLRKIKKGEKLTLENTFALRPAENGISIDDLESILGRKLNCDIEENQFIQFENLQ